MTAGALTGARGGLPGIVRRYGALPALAALLAATMLIAAGIGSFPISPAQSLAILLEPAGLQLPVTYSQQQRQVLLSIRLPQVVLAALVGGSLAVAGVVVQGIFRNPLASPSLIGVSGGASVAAALVIVLGWTAWGSLTLPIAAFFGGLVTCLAMYRFARQHGRAEMTTLLLAGLAMNALTGALVSLLVYVGSERQVRSIVFWIMGSVSGTTWDVVMAALPFIAVGVALLLMYGRSLNVLTLGDAPAQHLGVDTERIRLTCIVLVALCVGAGVAVAGVVGFVGLVVPHLLRGIVGPDHRVLLPASGLGGAALVVLADLLARTVVAPAQLPLGLVTSLIGAPFFFYLIDRSRREHGGWG